MGRPALSRGAASARGLRWGASRVDLLPAVLRLPGDPDLLATDLADRCAAIDGYRTAAICSIKSASSTRHLLVRGAGLCRRSHSRLVRKTGAPLSSKGASFVVGKEPQHLVAIW